MPPPKRPNNVENLGLENAGLDHKGSRAMKGLTLCADDYAYSAPVSEGIFALASAGRLQAISCMSDSPRWPGDGARLRELPAGVDIGLHLNFTEALGDATPTRLLGSLMLACWLRRLDRAAVRASIERQWQRFVDVTGHAPHFVDGHQHVHQFPQIREALFAVLKEKGFSGWLRCLDGMQPTPGMAIKTLALRFLGALSFSARARREGFRSNRYFGGVYDFSPQADYRVLMQGWLQQSPGGTLLMCHPAAAGASDSIGPARLREFQYFQSPDFVSDCEQNAVQLTRVTETAYAQV